MEGPKGLKPNRDVPAFNAIMQVLLTGFPEYPWDQIFVIWAAIEEYFSPLAQYNVLTL